MSHWPPSYMEEVDNQTKWRLCLISRKVILKQGHENCWPPVTPSSSEVCVFVRRSKTVCFVEAGKKCNRQIKGNNNCTHPLLNKSSLSLMWRMIMVTRKSPVYCMWKSSDLAFLLLLVPDLNKKIWGGWKIHTHQVKCLVFFWQKKSRL